MTLLVAKRRQLYVAGGGTPGASTPSGQFPISTVLGDMGLPNDWQVQAVPGKAWEYGPGYTIQGLPRGDANPTWWGGTGPETNSNPWPHLSPWILVCPGVGNTITGVRIHTKEHEVFALRASTLQWTRAPGTGLADIGWCDNFNSTASASYGGADRRAESDGHVSFLLPDSGSNTLHGGTNECDFSDTTDIIALHVRMKARLVPQTVGGSLAIANSRWMLQVGADWKQAGGPIPSPGYWAAFGASRCKALTADYQLFTLTNVKTNVMGPSSTQSYVETGIYNTSLKTALTEAELLAHLPPDVGSSVTPAPVFGVATRDTIYVQTVTPPVAAPVMTTSSLADGTAGVSYTAPLAATGAGTITFSATGLPSGLSVSGSAITGTTALSGIFPVEVTPTSSTGGAGAMVRYSLTIAEAAVADPGAWSPLLRRRIA